MISLNGIISDDDLIENYAHLLVEYALENGHSKTIIKKDNICQKVLRGNRHWFDRVLQKANENLYRDYGMKLGALPHIPSRPSTTSSASSNSTTAAIASSSSSNFQGRKSLLIISKSNILPPSDSYILFNARDINARLANPTPHPTPSDLTLLFIILSIMRLGNNSSGTSGNCLVNNLIKEEDLIDTLNQIALEISTDDLKKKLNEFKKLKYLNSYKRIDELGNQVIFYGAGARALLEIPLESLVGFTLSMAKGIQYNLTENMAKVAFACTDSPVLTAQEASITVAFSQIEEEKDQNDYIMMEHDQDQ